MTKFKVGDRVILKQDWIEGYPLGSVGTVTLVAPNEEISHLIGILWDDPVLQKQFTNQDKVRCWNEGRFEEY